MNVLTRILVLPYDVQRHIFIELASSPLYNLRNSRSVQEELRALLEVLDIRQTIDELVSLIYYACEDDTVLEHLDHDNLILAAEILQGRLEVIDSYINHYNFHNLPNLYID